MNSVLRNKRTITLIGLVLGLMVGLGVIFNPSDENEANQPSEISTNRPPVPSVSTWDVDAAIIPTSKLGIHLMLDDGRQAWPTSLWRDHLTAAREIVGEWGLVVQVVRSSDLDPIRWQEFMDLCAELQLTPFIRLGTTYDFENGQWTAPLMDDDGRYQSIAIEYAEFVAALNWPTENHYIIVGNEPNHGGEWGGVPDPSQYARFLIDVAEAIHAADPNSVVMNGGFDPYAPNTGSIPFEDGARFIDSRSFMDGMIAAEPDVFEHLDAWASHSYPLGAFIQPPWEQTFHFDYIHDAVAPDVDDPPAGIVNRGVNGYVWELYQLEQYGVDPLPVFITETGWRHAESTDPSALDGTQSYPDAETVALYIDLALYGDNGRHADFPEDGWIPWMEDPRVAGVVFFTLDGTPYEWGHSNWLELNGDGDILGTYPLVDVLSYEGD